MLKTIICIIISFFIFIPPVFAVTPESQQVSLTLEILENRLESPILIDGLSTIDLRNFIINLRDDNSDFRNQFYPLIKSKLNQSKQALGIDLSNSIIKGDFQANKLGLQVSLEPSILSSVLTPLESEKIDNILPFVKNSQQFITSINVFRSVINLSNIYFFGNTDFSNTLFLQNLNINQAYFNESLNFDRSIFCHLVDFNKSLFKKDIILTNSFFLDKLNFQYSQFQGIADFQSTNFQGVTNFSHVQFNKIANFTKTSWQSHADFSHTNWLDRVLFSKSIFTELVEFASATFEEAVNFRDTLFNQSINFAEVSIFDLVDFSNAIFTNNSYINVDRLAYLSESGKILGDSGIIGKAILVPSLDGNKNVFRNLIRNFRTLEQISDANSLEFNRKLLQQKQLKIFINESFLSINWFLYLGSFLWLTILLLLSHYGTNFSLIFAIGILAIAHFGILFWYIDRHRINFTISPTISENISVITTYIILTVISLIGIFNSSAKPLLTIFCLFILLFPIPVLLYSLLTKYNNPYLPNISYLVEDGEKRQIRLLIVRLPIIPRYDFFRSRYLPILWEKKWNWLNYYDFSLNNILKFGFNDIRLRDEYLPGIVSTIVWYQWCLGIFYIILLFWTLSRTIPGLNLLIYL